ncbi:MAG: dihydrolipoyllysine-residue succinyltransferase [Legionellales bacterium]|nr:dihydrolipoyllysine-residue succinyltransferase [Legionellales bacterium]|tara:strand:- start:4981 stop:6231 length:1251 start_codon:yes stop_codon:yes gene_type:complete
MSIEVKVPVLPESVADATVVTWHKKVGDSVQRDENLVDLETDKVVLEVPAPEDGVIQEILHTEGATVVADTLLARIEAGAVAKPAAQPTEQAASGGSKAAVVEVTTQQVAKPTTPSAPKDINASPAVRRLISEKGIDPASITGTGKEGRISKEDVMRAMSGAPAPQPEAPRQPVAPAVDMPVGERTEKRVPMSRLRARVAERLLDAQHNAAILTTFNEINMKPVMDLRKRYKDQFEKAHGVRLGFMSFFTKAVIEALKRFPDVNASIDGDDLVYHGYFDIGIAVSSPRGLVVPVLRNAENKSFADIERAIGDYATKARDGKLTVEEMTGGTFTITNGGVFGSLLSTPIINPPQSGILGMHKIEERAIVENGEVVVRPMMYVALSYDHRIIDGRQSVGFLVTIKELLEDPARLLLDV